MRKKKHICLKKTFHGTVHVLNPLPKKVFDAVKNNDKKSHCCETNDSVEIPVDQKISTEIIAR